MTPREIADEIDEYVAGRVERLTLEDYAEVVDELLSRLEGRRMGLIEDLRASE